MAFPRSPLKLNRTTQNHHMPRTVKTCRSCLFFFFNGGGDPLSERSQIVVLACHIMNCLVEHGVSFLQLMLDWFEGFRFVLNTNQQNGCLDRSPANGGLERHLFSGKHQQNGVGFSLLSKQGQLSLLSEPLTGKLSKPGSM